MKLRPRRKLAVPVGIAIMLHVGFTLPFAHFLPIQKTVEKSGSVDQLPSAVRLLIASRKYVEAREKIFRAGKLRNSKATLCDTQVEISACLIMVGEYDVAIKELTKPYCPVYAIDESYRRLLLSQAYIATSRYHEAIEELEIAKEMVPSSNSMRADIALELGKAFLGANDLPASAAAFAELRSLRANPKCAEVYIALLSNAAKRNHRLGLTVNQLLAFWNEFPLEARPNIDFLANYISKQGDCKSMKMVTSALLKFDS